MKFHIIQMGETIDEITFLYNITKDELKEENRHIRKWDKLIPGTKLKIPVITETIDSEVSEMEPFIEDYYPKLKAEEDMKTIENEEVILKEAFNEEEIEMLEEEEKKEIEAIDTTKQVASEPRPDLQVKKTKPKYPYYNLYYPYYYYSNIRVPYPIYYYPVYYRKK